MNTTSKPPPRVRFPLRTMFIVITMVTVAVALFVRYPDCVGVFFGLLVLLAGWCYLRGNKGGAIGHLAILAAFWLALQFAGPYTSLRNRVVWIVGTERLQQWAEPGETVVSEPTWAAMERMPEADKLAPAIVKGRDTPVAAYRFPRRAA